MVELEKIAEILKSALPDVLKLELIGLLANRQQAAPLVVPIYPIYPTYPIYPVYPTGPTWIGSGTGDPMPFPGSTTTCLTSN